MSKRTMGAALLAGAIGTGANGAIVIHDIPFPSPGAPGGSLPLDVYLPNSGVATRGYTIVMVHSGSYAYGDKLEAQGWATALADMGFAAVAPNYTLVTTPVSAGGTGSYPQPVRDVLNAVRWVRTDGETLGLPNPVVVFGYSAGGTIGMAAVTASTTAAGIAVFSPLPAPEHRGYLIDGAIGASGRLDLVWSGITGVPTTVIDYLGQTYSSPGGAALWAQASSITYVGACTAPMVLYHGGGDGLVPPQNSSHMATSLTQAGVPADLHVIPGVYHEPGTMGPTDFTEAQTMAAAVAWIDQNAQAQCGRATLGVDFGSCCAPSGACAITGATCAGTWLVGGSCYPNVCPTPPPPGACCAPSGACGVAMQANCSAPGMTWSAAPCSPGTCPQPAGACCAQDGSCDSTTSAACTGSWRSGACTPSPCPQPGGVCCAPDGTCTTSVQSVCAGTWSPGSGCAPGTCPQPPQPGACCRGVTCNLVVGQSGCGCGGAHAGAWFVPLATVCGAGSSCCPADYNKTFDVTVQDLFDFLGDWFAGSPFATSGGDGSGPAPTVQSLFDYLGAWFGGGC